MEGAIRSRYQPGLVWSRLSGVGPSIIRLINQMPRAKVQQIGLVVNFRKSNVQRLRSRWECGGVTKIRENRQGKVAKPLHMLRLI